MNLLKLKSSLWIIIINLILILILIWNLYVNLSYKYFTDLPDILNSISKMSPSITQLNDSSMVNNNYASILLFIQQNPQKSSQFISDIKQKFFKSSCEVKDNIDFKNIAQMTNGMPFS